MSAIAIQLCLALALFAGGFAGGYEVHKGIVAQRELAAQQARETDMRQQRRFNDSRAGEHAAVLANLNDQLGDARERIATLKSRACLDPGTVRVLNATGVQQRGAAAGEPAGAPASAAAGTDLRWSTNIDVGGYIALCRTRYAEVSGQLNQILDIEDRRHPPGLSTEQPKKGASHGTENPR